MVVWIPGHSGEAIGPQPGPEPAWARFTRTAGANGTPEVRLRSYKPDADIRRILGAEPERARKGDRERNRHNASVYVSRAGRQRGADVTRLPVMGEIAAGQFDVTVAFQEYDCLAHGNGVMVEKALARGGSYALRVRGTSMTHVGIEPGDVVVIKPQTWAEDGDFVVANYVDGEAGGAEGLATLKRFYKRRDHVFLQSATAATDPIRIFPNRRSGGEANDPVQIQGVVTMVLKPGA
jgi:SOS-response transcriptional repressor LexA